jgi:uncharacterized protein
MPEYRTMTRVIIEEIPPGGLHLELNENVAGHPFYAALDDSTLSDYTRVRFLAPLKVALTLRRIRGMVEMSGRLRSRIAALCSRCLIPLEIELDSRFQLMYARRPGAEARPSMQKEIELTTEDVGLMLFDGDVIDIRQGIYEEALAALPLKPLCRDDCQGLCPHCGVDLNRQACHCAQETVDPRLVKLKQLKREDPPEK